MITRRAVVTLDFRNDVDAVLTRPFSAIQRERAGAGASGFHDLGAVLIIDSPQQVVSHEEAYRRVVESQSVSSVICLLVGAPSAGARTGEALVLPAILQHPQMAVLWVGDDQGVAWGMGAATSSVLAFPGPGSSGSTALFDLVGTLTHVEVFERVVADCGPASANVPGLRAMVLGRSEDAIVAAAEARVVKSLIGGEDEMVSIATTAQPETLTNLLGTRPAPDGVIDPNGPVGRMIRDARDELAHAEDAIARLAAGPALRSDGEAAAARLRAFGNTMRSLRDLMASAIEDVDGSDGLNPSERERIAAIGIDPGKIRDAVHPEGDTIDTILKAHVLSLLRSEVSLDVIQSEMRSIAERAQPASPEETLGRMRHVLDDHVIDRLAEARSFTPKVLDALTLLGLFGAGIASGTMHAFRPVMVAANVLAPLYVLSALLHKRLWVSPAAAIRAFRSAPRALQAVRGGVLWPLSALAGYGLAWSLERSMDPRGAVGILGVVAAAVIYWLLFRLAWLRAVSTWRASVDIEGAGSTLGEACATLGDVAVNEWALSNPRLRLSRLARGVAETVREFEVLLASAVSPDEALLSASPLATSGTRFQVDAASGFENHDADVESVLDGDYVDLMTKVLVEGWPQFELQGVQDAASDLDNRFAELLLQYRAFRSDRGLLEAPEFLGAAAVSRRRALASSLWSTTTDLAEVLTDEAAVVQLIAPEQLVFLEAAPELAKVVRFAPGAARATVTRIPDVVFTSSETAGGILRLVPMRTGTIRIDSPVRDSASA